MFMRVIMIMPVFLVMRVVVTVVMSAVVMLMVVTVIIVMFVVMIVPIRAEAVGMGVDAGQLAGAARIGLHPLGRAQEGQGAVERGLLLIGPGRVLEADQVDAGDFQFHAQIAAVHGQVAAGHTVDVRRMLALQLGVGRAGQQGRGNCCNKKRTSLHACTPC